MNLPLLFHPDLMFPWNPAIYEGFREAPEFRDRRIRLVVYQQRPLLCLETLLRNRRPAMAGLLTAHPQMAELAYRKKIPVVFIGAEISSQSLSIPAVKTDYQAMGRLAVKALREGGFSRFALVMPTDERTLPLKEKIQGLGQAMDAPDNREEWLSLPSIQTQDGWLTESSQQALADFLTSQRQPIGLIAGNVRLAWGTSRAVQRSGLPVPQEVGLVAMGEDAVLLGQGFPPITGIREDGREIGRQAARLLAEEMNQRGGKRMIAIRPAGLVERASTARIGATDSVVLRALTLLRDDPESVPDVDSLALALHVSRSTLLRRFRQHVGRSPQEEIMAQRLKRALALIVETDQSLAVISEQTGFGLQSALSRAVRQASGLSPSEYRKQWQSPTTG